MSKEGQHVQYAAAEDDHALGHVHRYPNEMDRRFPSHPLQIAWEPLCQSAAASVFPCG